MNLGSRIEGDTDPGFAARQRKFFVGDSWGKTWKNVRRAQSRMCVRMNFSWPKVQLIDALLTQRARPNSSTLHFYRACKTQVLPTAQKRLIGYNVFLCSQLDVLGKTGFIELRINLIW